MISVIQAKADRSRDIGFTNPQLRDYRVGRAILASDDPKMDCLEREASHVLAQLVGRPPRGIYVPARMQMSAGLDTRSNGSGGYLVQTDILDLFGQLLAQLQVAQLGVTVIPGLNHSATFLTTSQSTQHGWFAENSGQDITETTPVYGAVTATPHGISSTLTISKQLLAQTSNNILLENKVRRDLMRSFALAVDAACITGSGTDGAPIGLLQTAGIQTVAIGQNGGVPTYSTMCDLEGAVAAANADFGPVGFLSTPEIRKKLRQTYVNGTGSAPVWEGDTVLNRPAVVSTNVPSSLSKGSGQNLNAIVCGKWDEMLLCEFGVFDLFSDPFTKNGLALSKLPPLGSLM